MGVDDLALKARGVPMETKNLDAAVYALGDGEHGFLEPRGGDPNFAAETLENGNGHNVG
jgi:hypothetical protein